jgi:hypothetical protein
MRNDSFQQAVEMLSLRIIVLHKGVESKGQIRPKLWRIVIFQGRVVRVIFVVLVIRKTGEFLLKQPRKL